MTHAKVLVVDGLWAVLGTTATSTIGPSNTMMRSTSACATKRSPPGCSRITMATWRERRSDARAMAALARVGEGRRTVRLILERQQ